MKNDCILFIQAWVNIVLKRSHKNSKDRCENSETGLII